MRDLIDTVVGDKARFSGRRGGPTLQDLLIIQESEGPCGNWTTQPSPCNIIRMISDELEERIHSAGEVEVERLRMMIGKPLDPRLERMIREASGNAYINGLRHAMCAVETQQDLVPLCEFLDEIEGQPNWHKAITFKGDEWKSI